MPPSRLLNDPRETISGTKHSCHDATLQLILAENLLTGGVMCRCILYACHAHTVQYGGGVEWEELYVMVVI